MIQKVIAILLLSCLFLSLPNHLKAVVPGKSTVKIEAINQLSTQSLISKKINEIEQEIGRALSFKENISLKIVKRKLKKSTKTDKKEVAKDGFAIAGFICGILGLVGVFFFVGIPFAILGIILSLIGLGRIKKNQETKGGRSFAIAGLILSIAGVILGSLLVLLILFALGF